MNYYCIGSQEACLQRLLPVSISCSQVVNRAVWVWKQKNLYPIRLGVVRGEIKECVKDGIGIQKSTQSLYYNSFLFSRRRLKNKQQGHLIKIE
jgi:hypothetical protein